MQIRTMVVSAVFVVGCGRGAPPGEGEGVGDGEAEVVQAALSPNPCTAVRLTAPLQYFTSTVGVPIALTGAATCPPGQTPEYQYWAKRFVEPNWTKLGGFVPGSSTFTPPTGEAWCVTVVTRAVGAPESYQARASSRCSAPRCGNAAVEAGEQCDDGNAINGDGCDNNCTVPACGNAIVDPGEQCDDGNPRNADGCETTCTVSSVLYVKPSSAASSAFFGHAIALSSDGGTLAIGAYGEAGDTGAVYVFARSGATWVQQARLVASNAQASDLFGYSVALSADGATLAVGAPGEDSAATGVGGNQGDDSASFAGAVYVFGRAGATWSQAAYLKASNTDAGDEIGISVALSADGDTLAAGAFREASAATGVGGDQSDNNARDSGAVYVFGRVGTTWAQAAYLKASNTNLNDAFGSSVALSADATTLAVGAPFEASAATGIDGDQTNGPWFGAGAVYVFGRSGATWSQQAYVKASNTSGDDLFGFRIALAADGTTLAVGAPGESSAASGVGGDQSDDTASFAGAVYLFTRNATWSQLAYVKASNPDAGDGFGFGMALSPDGNALAVGALGESSAATGTGGNQSDNSVASAGALYRFALAGATWSQTAYVKATNTGASDSFGRGIAVLSDGTLAVGAIGEASRATGLGGNQADNTAPGAGAVYLFR